MSLNIFPRKRETPEAATSNPTEQQLPEPSEEAMAAPARRTRAPRAAAAGTPATPAAPRATRSRKAADPAPADAIPAEVEGQTGLATAMEAAVESAPAPRSRTRAPRRVTPPADAAELTTAAVLAETPLAEAGTDPEREQQDDAGDGAFSEGGEQTGEGGGTGEGRARRRRGGRGRGRRNENGEREPGEGETSDEPQAAAPEDDGESQPRDLPRGRERGDRNRERTPRPEPVTRTDSDPASIARSIDAQGRQLADLGRQVERLVRTTEEIGRRPGGGGGGPAAPVVRVGVFVDTANIELACDRLRVRFDWGKVLRLVTNERQLVRAMAYSPIHDDLSVSIETQRFVEPFLDKGFKVVTKPFRRFQDGSIKANLDIELALDVVTMLDRLDVVVLISGDGDFQRLVELAQGRGVRVEVAAVGTSTATNLKHAADSFIDLGARARDLRS